MIYRIDKRGKKYAVAVKNREEFLALRNSKKNLAHLAKARQGDETEKAELVQFAYNLGHVNGELAGCKNIRPISSFLLRICLAIASDSDLS